MYVCVQCYPDFVFQDYEVKVEVMEKEKTLADEESKKLVKKLESSHREIEVRTCIFCCYP